MDEGSLKKQIETSTRFYQNTCKLIKLAETKMKELKIDGFDDHVSSVKNLLNMISGDKWVLLKKSAPKFISLKDRLMKKDDSLFSDVDNKEITQFIKEGSAHEKMQKELLLCIKMLMKHITEAEKKEIWKILLLMLMDALEYYKITKIKE